MFLAIIDKDDAPYCLPAVNEVKEASQRASGHFDTNIQCPCGKPQHSQLYRNIVVYSVSVTHTKNVVTDLQTRRNGMSLSRSQTSPTMSG